MAKNNKNHSFSSVSEKGKAKRLGRVSLVGAGPGDAGLMTLRGLECLREADAVVYDALVNPEILSFSPSALKIDAGKRHKSEGPRWTQKKINALLVRLARQGKKIVRLKGGDPFIFGRGGEEALALKKAGITFEIVSGVSSASAVPASAGIPITDRRFASQVTLITGHEDPRKPESSIEWKALAQNPGTLVFFMGVKNLEVMCRHLLSSGYDPGKPVAVIQHGTLSDQKVVEGNVANIARRAAKAGLTPPALTVIGDVVRLRKDLKEFKPQQKRKLKLQGWTVAVTRPKSQISGLKNLLERHGAQVLEIPTIEILPPKNLKPLDRAVKAVKNFDWILISSAHGAKALAKSLERQNLDARWLSGVRIASVGPSTAEALRSSGLRPDFVPTVFTSKNLAMEMSRKFNLKGLRLLIPRTDIAPPDLSRILKSSGAQVAEVPAYRTASAAGDTKKILRGALRRKKIDAVTFTSASSAHHFFDCLSEELKQQMKKQSIKIFSIGPVTTQAIQMHGFKPWKEASKHTVEGLMEAILQ